MSKKKNFRVSILVANYNNEIYLEPCIKSLLEQSYKNIEIIDIEDGSSDNSLKVLKKYKDKIIIIEKNIDILICQVIWKIKISLTKLKNDCKIISKTYFKI